MGMARPRLLPVAFAASFLGAAGCIMYLNPHCDDGIHDGSETDIDCGGSCARRCTIGFACDSGADCQSGVCASGRCVPQPCFNGVQDNAETDIDCGGGTCRPCAGGRRCTTGADCFNGQCETASKVCYSLSSVSFATSGTYLAGSKPYALLAGDLDGDGNLDLVTANELEDSVTVLLGNGDGTFRRAAANFPTGEYPTGGAIADFNLDGVPDVATANYHGNSVSILIGAGDGTLLPPVHYPTTAGAATSNLAVGDLDGDGYLDVVATNPEAGSISLLWGLPGGTLEPSLNVPVGPVGGHSSSAPFSAAIGDFDGDGKNDVAVADLIGRAVVVRLGAGGRALGPEVAHSEGGVGPFICMAGDVAPDGKLDVVCSNRGSDDVSVLPGLGGGILADPVVSGAGAGTGPYSLAVADFNLDGAPDVVTANFLTGTASVLLGVGDGRFEAPLSSGLVGDFTFGVATGDFNLDGRPDFAVCNATSNDVVVKLSTSQ